MSGTPRGDRRRDAIVEFVRDFWAVSGYAPTLAEIADGVGLAGAPAAAYQVDELVAAGRLARTPRIARSIRLVAP